MLFKGCNADITQNVVQVGLWWEFSKLIQCSGQIRSLDGAALLLFEPWAIASKSEHEQWGVPKKDKALSKLPLQKKYVESVSKMRTISPLLLDYVNLENDATLMGASWCWGGFLNKQNGAPDSHGKWIFLWYGTALTSQSCQWWLVLLWWTRLQPPWREICVRALLYPRATQNTLRAKEIGVPVDRVRSGNLPQVKLNLWVQVQHLAWIWPAGLEAIKQWIGNVLN